eukprot:scaffold1504_cov417-Prasinococcus_capsulatus_cf.AAC.29
MGPVVKVGGDSCPHAACSPGSQNMRAAIPVRAFGGRPWVTSLQGSYIMHSRQQIPTYIQGSREGSAMHEVCSGWLRLGSPGLVVRRRWCQDVRAEASNIPVGFVGSLLAFGPIPSAPGWRTPLISKLRPLRKPGGPKSTPDSSHQHWQLPIVYMYSLIPDCRRNDHATYAPYGAAENLRTHWAYGCPDWATPPERQGVEGSLQPVVRCATGVRLCSSFLRDLDIPSPRVLPGDQRHTLTSFGQRNSRSQHAAEGIAPRSSLPWTKVLRDQRQPAGQLAI